VPANTYAYTDKSLFYIVNDDDIDYPLASLHSLTSNSPERNTPLNQGNFYKLESGATTMCVIALQNDVSYEEIISHVNSSTISNRFILIDKDKCGANFGGVSVINNCKEAKRDSAPSLKVTAPIPYIKESYNLA
jgi:hypothetical protein